MELNPNAQQVQCHVRCRFGRHSPLSHVLVSLVPVVLDPHLKPHVQSIYQLVHLSSQEIGQTDTLEGKRAKALMLLPSWVTHVKLQQAELKCPQHLRKVQ